MTIQRIKDQGININTLLLAISILGGFLTAAWFLYPLKTLPMEMQRVQMDINQMAHTQTVQTEAIKTLAEVARDTKEMRRDIDRNFSDHAARIKQIEQRLSSLP